MSLMPAPALRYIASLRLLGPIVGMYLLTVALVGFVVDGGVFAVLLNLYLLRLGYGPEQIGMVNAAGMLVFALTSLPAGFVGERFGSRQMMLLGIGLMFVGTLLLPLTDLLPPAIWLGWLIGTNMLLYLGLALFFVNTAPFLMASVQPDQRTQVFGVQTALLSFSAFLGSIVGGILPPLFASVLGLSDQQAAPYRFALIVGGMMLLPALLALSNARPRETVAVVLPDLPTAAAEPAAPILGTLLLIALVRLLQVAGIAATTSYFNVYLDAALLVPTAQIGLILAAGRLLGVPAALATASLTRRFGNKRVVLGATIGSAISILPLALIPHWSAAAVGFVGLVGLSWIRYAASMVYFLELVPPNRRATVSGVVETAGGLCFTLITFGGGYVIALLGYQTLFLAAMVITLLSAFVFWIGFRGREALS
jgi:MFS family permease